MLNEDWGEPLNLYDGFISDINDILIAWGLEPLPIDPDSAAAQAPEQVSVFPEGFWEETF